MANEVDKIPTPEELQGISEETVREIMAEYAPEKSGEPEPVKTPEEGQEAVVAPDESKEGDVEDKPSDTPADSEDLEEMEDLEEVEEHPEGTKKTVPYAALKAERDKRKAKDVELSARDKVIEELKAKLEAKAKAPLQVEVPAQSAPQPTAVPQTKDDGIPYVDRLYAESEKIFKQRFGYAPTASDLSAKARAAFTEQFGRDYDPFNDDDQDVLSDMKINMRAKDTVRLNSIINDLDRSIQQVAANQKREQDERMATSKGFLDDLNSKENFQDILAFADERLKTQPTEMKKSLFSSVQRLQAGKATYEDISALKFFYESSELLYDRQQEKVKAGESNTNPEPPAKKPASAATKVEKKLEQAKSLPRSASLNGGGSSTTTTVAELARKLEDGSITDEELEVLKNGG